MVHDQRFTHYPAVVVADFCRYYPSTLLLRLGRESAQFQPETFAGGNAEIREPQVGENGRARSVECFRGRQTVLRRPSLADGRRDEPAPRKGAGIIAANSHAYLKAALRLNPQCVRIVRQLLCRGRQYAAQGRLPFPAPGEVVSLYFGQQLLLRGEAVTVTGWLPARYRVYVIIVLPAFAAPSPRFAGLRPQKELLLCGYRLPRGRKGLLVTNTAITQYFTIYFTALHYQTLRHPDGRAVRGLAYKYVVR